MSTAPAGRFIGQKVRRTEDRRLLRGEGRFVDDVVVPNMAHAAFVRSTVPHAQVRNIDVDAARALPGVVAVFSGRDMDEMTLPLFGLMPQAGGFDPMFRALSSDRVRHVGDPVAIVVAESRRVAEDAVELVEVDYESLPAIATAAHAFDPSLPPIWPDAGGNVLRRASRTHGDIDAAFSAADRVISERFTQTRHSNQPMETRGSVAEYVPDTDGIRFYSAHQSVHMLKWGLGMFAMPVSLPKALRQLVADRDRLKRMFQGMRAMGGQETDTDPGPEPMPVADSTGAPTGREQMKALFGGEKGRLRAMLKAFGGVIANGPDRVPEVITDDVGGAFGSKIGINREDVALVAAAQRLRRSIKWIEDRNENLMVGGHARDEWGVVDMAVRNDGTILGMRVHLTIDNGAYPGLPMSGVGFGEMVRVMIPGPYRVPALQFDQVAIATNKATIVAYRGPWAIETFLRERMLDVVARELGMTPAEVRLKNIVGPEELPTRMVTGPDLDIRMSAKRTLTDALEIADVDAWPEEQRRARDEGRILGMGFATFIEAAPGPPNYGEAVQGSGGGPAAAVLAQEAMRAVLRQDGTVALHTPQVPHGQGIATTMAQVAAEHLGVPYESIELVYGHTDSTPIGMGTGGSRSAAMAGGATTLAARDLRSQVIDVAADLLEAAVDDVEIVDGNIHVVGVPARGITMADVAAEVDRRGGKLEAEGRWDGGEGGWAQATHVCWVDIDLDTGLVKIPRYVVVEDCGEIINPAIVDGQIRGGVAQGVGSVLYERITYDEEANFRSGTYMDYLIPTAMEIPDIEIHHVQTPSDIEANYRGVGEGGMILAPAAITNAIEDALAHLGVRVTEQHLPPDRILELAGVV